MSVREYKKYKDTSVVPWYKAKDVKDFWKTGPTMEQERIRSHQIYKIVLTFGFISFCFFVLGMIVGGKLW